MIVCFDDSDEVVKAKVREATGIAIDQLFLVIDGKQLASGRMWTKRDTVVVLEKKAPPSPTIGKGKDKGKGVGKRGRGKKSIAKETIEFLFCCSDTFRRIVCAWLVHVCPLCF